MNRQNKTLDISLNCLFLILSALCLLPLILVLSISLSSESSIVEYGYTLIPKKLSFEAYRYIWDSKDRVFNAYGITLFSTVVGAGLSTLIIAMYAYPLSRSDFKFRRAFTLYIFITMLFGGGIVSWYMVCVRVLKLSNSIWALIIPHLVNAWYVLIMRTFFQTTIPAEIVESGKLDGAGEFRIFFTIVLPLSLPGIATIGLFTTLGYWNDWWLALMFITEQKLYNIQFLLQSLISNMQSLNEEYRGTIDITMMYEMPTESARMALCILVVGPIILVYPFFQKYFVQGLTIGAIKG